MIQPDLERAMAKKINAKVTALPTIHVPIQPESARTQRAAFVGVRPGVSPR